MLGVTAVEGHASLSSPYMAVPPALWEREPGLERLHGRLSCQAEKSVKVWPWPVRRLWSSASLLPRPPRKSGL